MAQAQRADTQSHAHAMQSSTFRLSTINFNPSLLSSLRSGTLAVRPRSFTVLGIRRMLSGDKHRQRHNSFSINAVPPKQPASKDPQSLLRVANVLITVSVAFLLVGFAPLFFPSGIAAANVSHRPSPVYLRFPYSAVYFLPLLIPLTTYIVIARWTGEKHYRHS